MTSITGYVCLSQYSTWRAFNSEYLRIVTFSLIEVGVARFELQIDALAARLAFVSLNSISPSMPQSAQATGRKICPASAAIAVAWPTKISSRLSLSRLILARSSISRTFCRNSLEANFSSIRSSRGTRFSQMGQIMSLRPFARRF